MHVYDTLSHGDTLVCQIWYEHEKGYKKKLCHVKKPINLKLIDVKDQRLMMIDPCDKHDMPIFKANGNYGSDTKPCGKKPYKFDLESKGKDHIGFMNIRDTLSHGNTPMCQVLHANVKAKRSHGPDTNLHEQMDGWTDRQSV